LRRWEFRPTVSVPRKEVITMASQSEMFRATREIPCSVVFVSVEVDGKHNAMTATAMYTSEKPALVAISVAKHILTHDLIEKAGEFVINVASSEQVGLARKLGGIHGVDVDKFKELGIVTEAASRVKSPTIKGSYAQIECKVKDSFIEGDYVVYIGEVVAFKVTEDSKPIVWFENKYYELGKEIG
jgi:flavin reductase (DIM6/NTAB) family NADH-FMN oxidoreductase RutF